MKRQKICMIRVSGLGSHSVRMTNKEMLQKCPCVGSDCGQWDTCIGESAVMSNGGSVDTEKPPTKKPAKKKKAKKSKK